MNETAINIISENTRLEGKIHFDDLCRVHGTLVGEIHAAPGSTLILAETSVVEGEIDADTLIVDGYVKGNITSRTKVLISSTGRVIGKIKAPKLKVEPGAFFEGTCFMNEPEITEFSFKKLKEGP